MCEFGSGVVSRNLGSALDSSSAFIFVTSLDSYRSFKCSQTLQELYSQNQGIEIIDVNYGKCYIIKHLLNQSYILIRHER